MKQNKQDDVDSVDLTKSDNAKVLIRDSIARWVDEEDYKIGELDDCIALMYEVDR